MSWKIGDPNRSFTYIMPMLGKAQMEFCNKQLFPFNNFRNCFVRDKNCPELTNQIFLLYKFSGKQAYINFEERLMEYPTFNKMYEPNKEYTMYIFDVPENHQEDYNFLMEGKYSLLSKPYKFHVLKFHELPLTSSVAGVLYKTEKRFIELDEMVGSHVPRQQEASSPFIWERETFKTEMLPVVNTLEKVGKTF